MNLESLTQAVGPTGDLCRKPCPCGCHGWYGLGDNGPLHPEYQEGKCAGKVWKFEHLIVQALWEECPALTHQNEVEVVCFSHFEPDGGVAKHCYKCHGDNYVHRPRAEAALRLLQALHKLNWEPGVCSLGPEEGWLATIYPDAHTHYIGQGPTAEDALAAAIEAKMRAAQPVEAP